MWLALEQSTYLLTKVAATTLSVMGITLAADRFGSTVGGALSGLPVVVGPAMFFLYCDFGEEFTANAAASSLMSLSATQVFLVVYCLTAERRTAHRALSLAGAAWLGAAFLLSRLPQDLLLGLLLFIGAMCCSRLLVLRILGRQEPVAGQERFLSLRLVVVRSVAAGLLVAVTTLIAGYLGSDWSGIIASYPIGFSFVVLTLHLSFGHVTAIAICCTAMLGLSSLAAFAFVLSLTMPVLPAGPAFALALGASIMATGITFRATRASVELKSEV